jgi:hypothetical protein
LKVKELKEFLERFHDEDDVRFFTDKGSKELPHSYLLKDDILYKHVAIIEVEE